MSAKQPRPGMVLRDPLHGKQACPKLSSSHQGVDRGGVFRARPPMNSGTNLGYLLPFVERLKSGNGSVTVLRGLLLIIRLRRQLYLL